MRKKLQTLLAVLVMGIFIAGIQCEVTDCTEYWYDQDGERWKIGQMDSLLLEVPWDVEGLGCDKKTTEEDVFEQGKFLGYGAYSEEAIRTVLEQGYMEDYVDDWIEMGTLPEGFTYTKNSSSSKSSTSSSNKQTSDKKDKDTSGTGSGSESESESKSGTGSGSGTTTTASENHEHDYKKEITKEATCTETGEITYTCECGDTYTEEIPLKEHTYVYEETSPTCEEPGSIVGTCEVCGDVTTEEIPALGHKAGEWKVEKKATAFSKGKATLYCSRCNETIKTKEIPATVMPLPALLTIVVIVVVAAGVVVVLFLKKKKEKK